MTQPNTSDPAAADRESIDAQAQAEDYVTAAGALLATDAIAKLNAGAALTFAVYSLPKDVVMPLMKDAPRSFIDAYGKACTAYGVGKR